MLSVEGSALSAVKPWSSFQCSGIHHAVRAPTYKGDEHLAYALNKSMAALPLLFTNSSAPSLVADDDEVGSSRPVRARMADESYSRVAISLTDTTNKAGVAASCTRLLLL